MDKGTLIVNPGDVIVWNTNMSDMLFAFPLDMEKYFIVEENQFQKTDKREDWPESYDDMQSFERRVERIEEGESLILRVNPDAPEGRIDYDIYVYKAEDFVVGNSPPAIIIQRPIE